MPGERQSLGQDAEKDLVITPGGPRERRMVHLVRPGETVSRDESGKTMIDPSERSVVAIEDLVLTPGGFRQKAQVHLIEPGSVLDGSGGRHRKVARDGTMTANFGPHVVRLENRPLMPANVTVRPGGIPAFGSGWIAYTGWTNSTGRPITVFRTTWTVPPVPTTQSGQTVFLFNGIQNSTMIYQPVLQWGVSAAGGGNYWGVASWYADGQGGPAFHSTLVQVNPGDVLVGVMTLTNQSGSSFSYNCLFQGIANTGLPITNVQELTWANETLEAYGITRCSDYPATDRTAFTGIGLQTALEQPH